MTKSLFFISLALISTRLIAQDASSEPKYPLVYHQNFERGTALRDFEMTDPKAWRLASDNEGSLELFGKSDYEARVRSPFNIALIRNLEVGSFVLEMDLAQTGREYGHRDLCLFFAAKDPTNFYYVHIASVADDHANNIFLVNDEPRVKVASKTTEGTDWGKTGSWHKVRIERNIEVGSIKVFFDNMTEPIMEATDLHFDFGRIGFGSFDDTGRFDNIQIWGNERAPAEKGMFE